jgi:hypothetical protein
MDLVPTFNELLKQRESPPVRLHVFNLEEVDEFLKEAYRIVRSSPTCMTNYSADHVNHVEQTYP